MTVVRHGDPDAFLAAAEPLLARNPAVRAFVASFVLAWRAGGPGTLPGYAATWDDGAAHGLGLLREGPLVIENSDPPAAAAFADDLADHGVPLANVIGEPDGCAAFAQAWNRRTGAVPSIAMHLRHHMLTTLAAPQEEATGTMRVATARDLPWLTVHALAFAQQARLPDRPDQVRASVMRRVAQQQMRILDDDGPVAFAACAPAGARDARIGLVYTLPDERGRGHATTLVAALVAECLAAGMQRVFLITDVGNPTSNALYARIGFEPVSDSVRLDFTVPPA